MKDQTVRFRCSHTEKDQLVATAEKAGCSVSDYIRGKVFGRTGPTPEELQEDKANWSEADKQAKEAIDAHPIAPQARTYRNGDEGLIQEEMRKLTHRIPVSYQRRAAAIQNLKKEGKLHA